MRGWGVGWVGEGGIDGEGEGGVGRVELMVLMSAPPLLHTLLNVYQPVNSSRDHAKLLWKRIPPALKLAHSELGRLWEIGKKLWRREFEAVYGLVGEPSSWPEYLSPMVTSLIGKGLNSLHPLPPHPPPPPPYPPLSPFPSSPFPFTTPLSSPSVPSSLYLPPPLPSISLPLHPPPSLTLLHPPSVPLPLILPFPALSSSSFPPSSSPSLPSSSPVTLSPSCPPSTSPPPPIPLISLPPSLSPHPPHSSCPSPSLSIPPSPSFLLSFTLPLYPPSRLLILLFPSAPPPHLRPTLLLPFIVKPHCSSSLHVKYDPPNLLQSNYEIEC